MDLICNKIELDFDIVGLYVSADENNTLEALSSRYWVIDTYFSHRLNYFTGFQFMTLIYLGV